MSMPTGLLLTETRPKLDRMDALDRSSFENAKFDVRRWPVRKPGVEAALGEATDTVDTDGTAVARAMSAAATQLLRYLAISCRSGTAICALAIWSTIRLSSLR